MSKPRATEFKKPLFFATNPTSRWEFFKLLFAPRRVFQSTDEGLVVTYKLINDSLYICKMESVKDAENQED